MKDGRFFNGVPVYVDETLCDQQVRVVTASDTGLKGVTFELARLFTPDDFARTVALAGEDPPDHYRLNYRMFAQLFRDKPICDDPPLTEQKETILEEAARITSQDRRKEYGPVRDSFHRIAQMWSQILGCNVTMRQVGLCMIALKISRDCAGAKRDNLVDIAGYARTLEMLGDGL